MNSLSNWSYADSVARVKPMVVNWRNLTVELVDELYVAHKCLSERKPLKGQSDVTIDTWDGYIRDVGLNRRTVHRWLERYVPEERKLLTPEEAEERKQIENRKNQEKATAIHKRVQQAISTGSKPADWDDETERAYQRKLKEDAERKRAIDEAVERERKAKEDRRKQQEQRQSEKDSFWEFDAGLDDAVNSLKEQSAKRRAFKEKIRLSQSGESDVFIDALMDYLEELDDDNRRIEACQNIIKVCKNIAAELQR